MARQERKVVTALFADLVGFTARAEAMDPEDVAALLSTYHSHLRDNLERFGGTVEKFIGDAVVAVFGAPSAHEDDPERAVRAALAIRDWARESSVELRIGIATGEALVTLGGEPLAAGDVVNTAARLQQAAPPGGVLVGEPTFRATNHVIEYGEHASVEAKGKSAPVAVWEALQARARLGAEPLRAPKAPLVGRRHELDALRNGLERARRERAAQLVTLIGEPGIGKSRLVYELLRPLEAGGDAVLWLQGRSLPYGDGVSFWALAELVKAQAGILESDTPDDAEEKLERAVGALVADASEAQWVLQHLRPLVGIGAAIEVGGDGRGEEFAAWRRFFEAVAERQPLVLIFEDVHWADENLLDFVDHLVEWASGVPLLLIATARPEFLSRRSGWGGGKTNTLAISLSPLSHEETATLLAELVERDALVPQTHEQLLSRAGGNPFYAEQYARMLSERGRPEELPLPESVHGLIAARLDGLAPDEKRLLQDAAVVGEVFWAGAVAALGRDDRRTVEERLHALQRLEFVQRARRSSVADETEYAFRHLLLRDVAYGQIPRARRGEKHQAAAEWIESLGRPEDHAELLTHHYSSALELARAAGADVGPLEQRVRHALRDAGDRALALNAYGGAAAYYRAALELWPEDPTRPYLLFRCGKAIAFAEQGGFDELTEASERLSAVDPATAAEAQLVLANLAWFGMSRAETRAHVARAAELTDAGPASRAKASVLSTAAGFHMTASEYQDAIRLGRQALQLAEALELPHIRAAALDTIGCSRCGLGDPGGLEDIEQSIAVATAANSPPNVVRGYMTLSGTLTDIGDLDGALAAQREGLRLAERFGLVGQARFLAGHVAQQRYFRGEWDEEVRAIDQAIGAESSARLQYSDRDMYEFRARIRLARGDLAGALADATRALDLARSVRESQSLLPALALAARVQCARGRTEEAGVLADELLQLLSDTGFVSPAAFFTADLVVALLALDRAGEFLHVVGRAPANSRWFDAAAAFASREFERAAAVYAEIGSVPDEAYARLRAAERALEQGRRAEADEQLERALAFYRSVGATAYIEEGEALVAATA